REHYKLAALKVTSETGTVPHARVVMGIGDSEVVAEVTGDGPVDAVFKAIERMVSSRAALLLYSVNAITTGSNAQGEVTVRLERDGRIVNGNGADTDIIVASAKAYLNALNKLQSGVIRLNPQLAA
ncbi:MAG: 2-isopropylmalate synthase, partial [Betaproteobacteria bacterium]